jgi:hypothetical protein
MKNLTYTAQKYENISYYYQKIFLIIDYHLIIFDVFEAIRSFF